MQGLVDNPQCTQVLELQKLIFFPYSGPCGTVPGCPTSCMSLIMPDLELKLYSR